MEIIPKRKSIVAQTTEVLRMLIKQGEWDQLLPTEEQLKTRMQVGRNTVRAALVVLEKEGLISPGRPGIRRSIIYKVPKPTPAAAKVVAFLTPSALEQTRSQVIFTVDGLRGHLAEMGYRLEIHTSKAFQMEHPERTLESLIQKNPASLWVLHLSTRSMQAWFSEKGIPCLVYGSTHDGVRLPCVDLNYPAITRHAIGQLTGKGHHRIAMMLPEKRLFGDLQAEEAFMETIGNGTDPEREGIIIRIPDNTPQAVCSEFRKSMLSERPPTGLILWRANYASTIFSYAHELDIRIPRDLSIVCTDSTPQTEWLVPDLARYQVETGAIITRLFRTVYKLLTIGAGDYSHTVIIPKWLNGQSISTPPAQRT